MKYTSWKKLGDMTNEEAKRKFVEEFKKVAPQKALEELEALGGS